MAKLKLLFTVLFFLISFTIEPHPQTKIKEKAIGTATVSGQVTVNGQPVQRVTVTLQERGNYQGSPIRTKTDHDGRFHMTGIAAGTYMINVVAPNYIVPSEGQGGLRGRTLIISEGERVDKIELELVRGGVITGKVTDSNRRPIVETTVWIVQVNQQGQPISSMRQENYHTFYTDDRGIYRIYGIPAGRYRVSVGTSTQQGIGAMVGSGIYIPRTFYPDVTEESKAQLVEVSEDKEVTDVDISVAELKKAYEVSGRVLDIATGTALPNVTIRYGPVMTNNPNQVSNLNGYQRSNNRGEFVLQGFLPGTYKLYVVPDGNSEFYSDSQTVEVTGEDVQGVELKAKRGGVISGIVILDGVIDPKVLARLSSLSLSASSRIQNFVAPASVSTRVNPDGTFRIQGLGPGKISMYLYSSGMELRGITIERFEKDGVVLPREFDFAPGQQLENLRIVANYGTGIVRGKISVLGYTLPAGLNFGVTARKLGAAEPSPPATFASVDARGQFLFERLPPGEYSLRLSINSYPRLDPNATGAIQIKPEFYEAVRRVNQQVSVTNGAVAQVTLVLDLSSKEGNQ